MSKIVLLLSILWPPPAPGLDAVTELISPIEPIEPERVEESTLRYRGIERLLAEFEAETL